MLCNISADTIQPRKLSDVEIGEFTQRERGALSSSEWGTCIRGITQLDTCIMSPDSLTLAETATFKDANEPDFEPFIGRGEISTEQKILLFLPDRILDMLDMVSFNASCVGIALGAEIHLTRYGNFGLGYYWTFVGLRWGYNRNLAFDLAKHHAFAGAGPLEAYHWSAVSAGTGWSKGKPGAGDRTFRKRGIFSRNERSKDPGWGSLLSKSGSMVEEGWRDPWGIGCSAGFGLLGAVQGGVEIHPIEIADFFAGLFTAGMVDISRDDYANPNRAQYKIGLPIDDEVSQTQPDEPGESNPENLNKQNPVSQ